MAEQEIPREFSVRGLLKKIVFKTTSVVLTKDSGHPVVIRKDTSTLQIITDSGETIPVDFMGNVGYELNGKRVAYSSKQEVKTAAVEGIFPNVPVIGNYRIVTQMLIPEDRDLPHYIVNSYTLLDKLSE